MFDNLWSSRLAVLAVCILGLGLAGCEEIVDFSGRPNEKLQAGTAETAGSAIYVAEPIDTSGLDETLAGLIPAEVTTIGRRIKKAQCRSSEGEEICRTAMLRGAVIRDGQVRLKGIAGGVALEVPLRADLTARIEGADDASPQQSSHRYVLTATYKAQLDEAWQIGFELAKDVVWNEPPTVQVHDATASIEAELLDELLPKLRRFAGRLGQVLQPNKLKGLTAEAWRALHAPIQIASGPEIWLSGEPRDVRFGGFADRDGGLEIRTLIATRLRTYVDERPKPLWPADQPALNAAPGSAIGGIVLPIDVGYEDLRAKLKQKLMLGVAVPAVAGEPVPVVTVRDVTLYPVGTRLGIGIDMVVKVPGVWRGLRGYAHFLATPVVEPGSNRLGLGRAELIDPSVIPDQYKRDLAAISRREFADEIAKAMDFDIGQSLERAMQLVNAAADRFIGDGLRLKGKLTSWRVGTIETSRNGLRLNAEFLGDLTIREDKGAQAAAVPAASEQQ